MALIRPKKIPVLDGNVPEERVRIEGDLSHVVPAGTTPDAAKQSTYEPGRFNDFGAFFDPWKGF